MLAEQKSAKWQLFWVSFLILFAEIMALRWMSIEFTTLKAFPNLVIMVILIAISAGLTWSESKLSQLTIMQSKLPFCGAIALILMILITAPQFKVYEQSFRLDQDWYKVAFALVFLLSAMASLYLIFLRLGILLKPLFDSQPPLTAYTINLLGSIFGVVIFGLISYLSAPPAVWLLAIGFVVFAIRKKKSDLLIAILFAGLAFYFNHQSYWSPYSKLDIVPVRAQADDVFVPGSYLLNSNNLFFHTGTHALLDSQVSQYLKSKKGADSKLKELTASYLSCLEAPYQCALQAKEVLILGAGSGNDVAYAIAKNVQNIDAVEIDPIICKLGKTKHPDRPYLDPRVSVHNEDARTFLRYDKKKYDLIEFAFLDPGNTVRASSFLRVDNYVYTVESIKSVLRCLAPNGVGFISFASDDDSFITHRLYKTIMQACGKAPLTMINKKARSALFLFGPGADQSKLSSWLANHPGIKMWTPSTEQLQIRASTDQWPFLYTDFNYAGIWLYLGTLAVVIVLPSLVIFHGQSREAKFAEMGNMFFLGLAFMLIETKAIVELSLLFGATWIVSSVVIAAILTLALLANFYVQKTKRIPLAYIYGALVVCLALQYFLSVPERTEWSPLVVAGLASLVACLPIFFSGMVFSYCFREAKNPSSFLAANLLGVAFGGLTENLSLTFGIKGLIWIALCIYCLSALCLASSGSGLLFKTNKTGG